MSPFEISLLSLSSLILLLVALNFYVYFGFRDKDKIIRKGPKSSKVALTFDDGPDPHYTPQILDVLKKHKIKATFFVVGKNVEKYPAIVSRLVKEGHSLGNHSYNHANLLLYKTKTVARQLQKTNEIIFRTTGLYPLFFRPPRGLYDRKISHEVEKMGQRIVLWNISIWDWSGLKLSFIIKRILKRTQGGDILLFHDSGNLVYNIKRRHDNTVEALPEIISGLRKKGFRLVDIPELLEEK